MKRYLLILLFSACWQSAFCWGFYAHKLINYQAVFRLPPPMLVFFKKHIQYLRDHAVDPDKRRYILPGEGPRHFIDLDHYGPPFDSLPKSWNAAVAKFSADSLQAHGIVPWWVQTMQLRLTRAFREKQTELILKLAADLGHYISDAHVPLHACSNYDGQQTNQRGIHALWESALPEAFAEKEWQLYTSASFYIRDMGAFIWQRVFESGAAADSVLKAERMVAAAFPPDSRYAYGERNGQMARQFSIPFLTAFHLQLNEMAERRLKQSIEAVAACWFTAWVNAGQPQLIDLLKDTAGKEWRTAVDRLTGSWRADYR